MLRTEATMSDPLILAGLALACIATGALGGWLFGVHEGEQRGRDGEWLDQFFRRVEQEKKRRDNYGRFKTKTKKER